jgi:hypothetical protein
MKNVENHPIYQLEDGALQVRFEPERDTVWLSLQQIAGLFERDKSVISKHLRNIFSSEEISREATVANFATVQMEGNREVSRTVEHFNLDVVLAVGYRVSSKRATRFRQWATQLIKQHLNQGYTLNQQRLQENAHALNAALELVRKAAQAPELTGDMGRGLVDVLTRYTQTFLLLQSYDQGLLTDPPEQLGGVLPTVEEARHALLLLKTDLIQRGEATELFAQERGEGFIGLLGNLNQSIFGEPAYPSIESKAAHLLYFVIKNHPFADGNKRSGAFLFVDFLHRNGRLLRSNGEVAINDTGLAALALLIAESKPDQKEVMIKLVMAMLGVPTSLSAA